MRAIKERAKKKDIYSMKILCLESFMLYLFLKELKIIKENVVLIVDKTMGGESITDASTKVHGTYNTEEKISNFFSEYSFTQPAQRASFCVGMLVDHVLYVQRANRGVGFGDEPFWNNLYGLVMDEKKIKNIFVKALAKMRQYRSGYPSLEAITAKYLAEAEGRWNLSNDELSYYFVLGLTLGKVFIQKKNEE